MKIVELKLNKGIDITAREFDKITGEPIYRYLGNGRSVADTVIKLDLYGDGVFEIKFRVHDNFIEQDYKKYYNRISKLIALSGNIQILHEPLQEVVDGHLFENNYVMICEYVK